MSRQRQIPNVSSDRCEELSTVYPDPVRDVIWSCCRFLYIKLSVPHTPLRYFWGLYTVWDIHINRSDLEVVIAQVGEVVVQMNEKVVVQIYRR